MDFEINKRKIEDLESSLKRSNDEHRELELEIGHKVIVQPCTSESYDFINLPFDYIDRGDYFLNTPIAVIDGSRKRSRNCDESELTFLSNRRGLVHYRAVGGICKGCNELGISEPNTVSINAHGFICAAIIASRHIPQAKVGDFSLGGVRGGSSSPPRLALYATGCPSCLKLEEGHMAEGISAAREDGVSVISMSLARELPSYYYSEDENEAINERDMASLAALKDDILTVVSAGNLGNFGLKTVAKADPWCLTVASCSSRKRFKTKLTFGGHIATFEIEAESLNTVQCDDWMVVRCTENIYNRECRVFYDTWVDMVKIEASSEPIANTPSDILVVDITKRQSIQISDLLDRAKQEGESVYVQISCSVKTDTTDSPMVSPFSSRGPCDFFRKFMKPDISAPGEEIAAAWPIDVPLGGFGPPKYAEFNILSGTSFSVPQVATAAAILRDENKWSATATISAIITTAKKMEGKDPVAFEFAYGAGMIDVKRARRPGLVYEESHSRFEQWFVNNSISYLDLNIPYFSTTFSKEDRKWKCQFPRKLKNVEIGKCSYVSEVKIRYSSPKLRSTLVHIVPSKTRLTFEELGDEQEFELSVELPYTKVQDGQFVFISGSLIWQNEDNDELTVDSPIIISSEEVPERHIVEMLYASLNR